MSMKEQLKKRLLEIPINSRAYREKHRLAKDLNIDVKLLEFLLNELVAKNILKEKIQYICPNCRDTSIMDNEMLNEILEESDEEKSFSCDNCMDYINPEINRTGYVFYDIKDKQVLIHW